MLISITQRGYIKRVAAKALPRAEPRRARRHRARLRKEEDEVLMLIPARTLDTMLFFSDRGKVYSEKAYQIPDADRTDRGIPMVNVLSRGRRRDDHRRGGRARLSTRPTTAPWPRATGEIKRVALSEFASVRPSGLDRHHPG